MEDFEDLGGVVGCATALIIVDETTNYVRACADTGNTKNNPLYDRALVIRSNFVQYLQGERERLNQNE